MRKEMKRRMGWIVLVVIFMIAMISLIVALTATKNELAELRGEFAEAQSAIDKARSDEQIEALLLAAITAYTEGREKDSFRLFDYAIEKMADQQKAYIDTLPKWLLRDPVVAKKFGIEVKKNTRHFGGG